MGATAQHIEVKTEDGKVVEKYKNIDTYLKKKTCVVTSISENEGLVVMSYAYKRSVFQYELPWNSNVKIGDEYVILFSKDRKEGRDWSNFTSVDNIKKWYGGL